MERVYKVAYDGSDVYVDDFSVGSTGYLDDYDTDSCFELDVTAVIDVSESEKGVQSYIDDEIEKPDCQFDLCAYFSIDKRNILVLFNIVDDIEEIPDFDEVICC